MANSALWEIQVVDGMRQLGLHTSPENLVSYALLVNVDEAYMDAMEVQANPDLSEVEYYLVNGRARELYSFSGCIIRNEAIARLMPDFAALWRAKWKELLKTWMVTEATYWNDVLDTAEAEADYEIRNSGRGHIEALELLESLVELS